MKITIECSVCGNKVEIAEKPNSMIEFKKVLEDHKFAIEDVKVEDGQLKSFLIQCKNCNKDHIELKF